MNLLYYMQLLARTLDESKTREDKRGSRRRTEVEVGVKRNICVEKETDDGKDATRMETDENNFCRKQEGDSNT